VTIKIEPKLRPTEPPSELLAAIRRDPPGTWLSVIPSSWFPHPKERDDDD
jgi:hypothetical protein